MKQSPSLKKEREVRKGEIFLKYNLKVLLKGRFISTKKIFFCT